MYIDSPQFPKRKVVNQKSQPVGGFGFERLQLANYVADELNKNHKDDAAILQKFRKQAQQYKRNLLRRKHMPAQLSSQPTIKPQAFPDPIPPNATLIRSTPIRFPQPSTQRLPTSHSNYQGNYLQIEEKSPPPQQVIVREIVKVSDEGNKQLIKIIQRKDKELGKQAKIIRRNQEKINDLRKRLEVLQYENRMKEANRLAELEQGSYEKIKGFISSMSHRLAQNHELLEQNLSQIKHRKKNSLSSSPSKPNPFPEPYSPPLKKAKTNSRFLLPLNESEPNPEPKISYSNRISNEKSMREQKYGINSIIDNLSTSRNRLDALGSFV